jgi:hypothetical protein
MIHPRAPLLYALLCAHWVGALSALALTDSWTVDLQQNTAVQRTYKRGESWDMTITLREGREPCTVFTNGSAAVFYWYSNSTDNAWWTNSAAVSASGVVTAAWTPAMDSGAAVHPYWVGLWTPGATTPVWRVNGTIRLLGSPGANPPALPMPAQVLDFSRIAVTNAPYLSLTAWQAGSNALANAIQSGGTPTNYLKAVLSGSLYQLYLVTP